MNSPNEKHDGTQRADYWTIYTDELIKARTFDSLLLAFLKRPFALALYALGVALFLVCVVLAIAMAPQRSAVVFLVFSIALLVVLAGEPTLLVRKLARRSVESRRAADVLGKEFGTRFEQNGFWFFRHTSSSFIEYETLRSIHHVGSWVFISRSSASSIAIPSSLIPRYERDLIRSRIAASAREKRL